MNLTFTAELATSEKEIERLFMDECHKKINGAATKAIPEIKTKVSLFIEKAIKSSSEYESLLSGDLKAQFGLINGASVMAPIIKAVSENVEIEWFPAQTPKGESLLRVSFIQRDHSDILGLPSASYKSNEFNVPWLKWLLTGGYDIIISDYEIKLGSYKQSRSKMAVMEKGGIWQVPTWAAGYVGYNFLTRAFEGTEDILLDIIEQAITKWL